MPRQRLTIKRVDPWSVMKFGFLTNVSLLGIGLVGAGATWIVASQLGLVTKACSVVEQFGVQNCGVNGGNLFRALLLLGLLGVIVVTGLLVFLSFLFNLVSDLVGGMEITVVDRASSSRRRPPRGARSGQGGGQSGAGPQPSAGAGQGSDVTRAGPAARPPAGQQPDRDRDGSRGSPPRPSGGEPIFGDRGSARG